MSPIQHPIYIEPEEVQCKRLNVPLALLEELKQHFVAPDARAQHIVSLTYIDDSLGSVGEKCRKNEIKLKCLRKLSRKYEQIIHAAISSDKNTIVYRIRKFDSNHERLEALLKL